MRSSYGPYSYGLYNIVTAYTVFADIVMACVVTADITIPCAVMTYTVVSV